ncbi:MAG: CGNR zinc finger domain-containing protein [Pseudonocardiaceae bacterium]
MGTPPGPQHRRCGTDAARVAGWPAARQRSQSPLRSRPGRTGLPAADTGSSERSDSLLPDFRNRSRGDVPEGRAEGPRREWCSTTCGNRVRAARRYQRHRS